MEIPLLFKPLLTEPSRRPRLLTACGAPAQQHGSQPGGGHCTAHGFNRFARQGRAFRCRRSTHRTISGIRQCLTATRKAGGEELVRAYLRSEGETQLAHRLNGWKGVTYRTSHATTHFAPGLSRRDPGSSCGPDGL
ncbi:hypothetical protein ACH419_36660 [Streptomyces bobili]|uniref:hypothetical protein n=1 Tax=Streptomyces bobili TaxID=67280 RepID=UPI00378E2CB2